MEPQVRYVRTTDGVSIAYWALGSGRPLLVSPPMAASHLTLEWRVLALADWYQRAAEHRTLVRWDPRGNGLSDREVDLSLEGFAADIDAVRAALSLSSFDLIATGGGSGESNIAYAAQHQGAVGKLVLISPELRGRDIVDDAHFDAVASLLDRDYYAWAEAHARLVLGWDRDDRLAHAFAGLLRASRTPEDHRRFIQYVRATDYTHFLAQVRAETLVIHIPFRRPEHPASGQSRVAATGIPDARYVELERDPNRQWYAGGRPVALIDEFLGIDHAKRELPSGSAVIFFADIAESTALTERLGDAAFRERARGIDAAIRTTVREAGGTPIEGKVMGDGVMAVFGAAREAIKAGLRCREISSQHELPLHLGIHAGDVIRDGNNVYGGAVNIAARVCDASTPGEIWTTEIVRGLARTSAGVAFEERGEHTLRGIDEPLRLYVIIERA